MKKERVIDCIMSWRDELRTLNKELKEWEDDWIIELKMYFVGWSDAIMLALRRKTIKPGQAMRMLDMLVKDFFESVHQLYWVPGYDEIKNEWELVYDDGTVWSKFEGRERMYDAYAGFER